MDGMKVAWGSRGVTMEAARKIGEVESPGAYVLE